MKKRIIDLKVNDWNKLSVVERKKAAKWLRELASTLVKTGDYVYKRFTGIYP